MARIASTSETPMHFQDCEKENESLPDRMEHLNLDLEDSPSSADIKQADAQEDRKFSVERRIYKLIHTHECKYACQLSNCQEMKRVVTHTKYCKTKTNGSCLVCKKLAALCCYHEKYCQRTQCAVPFCSNFQSRHQQAQLLKKKTAVRKNRSTG